MSYQILKEIENEIVDAINPILDEYLQGRTAGTSHARNVISRSDYDSYFDGQRKTIYDAKKDFNKEKNAKQLVKDIKYAGYRNFCNLNQFEGDTLNELEYRKLVVKLLNDIIRDRIALEKDKKHIMENTKSFEQYFQLNEMKLPIMKLDEIIDDVTVVSNDTLKRVLVSYYKTYDDYIDCSDKKKHLFKVHDMVGDIMNNNRVSFDVCIFDKGDLERIKVNLVDFAIGEFHTSLPTTVNIFGNEMKPSSFLNKDELKIVFEGMFTHEEIVKIITEILTWNFDGQFNDFYIWSNKTNVKVTQAQNQPVQTQPVQTQTQPVQEPIQTQETKSFEEFLSINEGFKQNSSISNLIKKSKKEDFSKTYDVPEEVVKRLKDSGIVSSDIFTFAGLFKKDSFRVGYITNGKLEQKIKELYIEDDSVEKNLEKVKALKDVINALEKSLGKDWLSSF